MPREFLRAAVESELRELFGEDGAKAVLFQLAEFAEMRSAEEFLLKVEVEPEFLYRTLTTMFGEASESIYRLIEEKVREMES